MKVIIMCAGKGDRWGKETPKEIAEVEGEPNVVRTIRLLPKYSSVITSRAKEHFFKHLKVSLGSDEREIDRFRNAFPHMKKDTLILYGDVVYNKADMQKILQEKPNENTFYGRFKGNLLTGKTWGEIFAVRVVDSKYFIDVVNEVARLFETGKIQREIGWEVYRVSNGIDVHQDKVTTNFIELSHLTDDYDTPHEYELVTKNIL